eukprot:Skav217348  [mRNA]  locus=scaffold1410:441319:442056:- [translate_table: standard]
MCGAACSEQLSWAIHAEQQAALEEAKEASKALERQRCLALTELHGLVARGRRVVVTATRRGAAVSSGS